jgi:hypothetical protein
MKKMSVCSRICLAVATMRRAPREFICLAELYKRGLREVVWADFTPKRAKMPVDSRFSRLGRCSETNSESEMIPPGIGRRHCEADPDYIDNAAAFTRRI